VKNIATGPTRFSVALFVAESLPHEGRLAVTCHGARCQRIFLAYEPWNFNTTSLPGWRGIRASSGGLNN
jgi:hypothetical protein